MTTIPFRPFPFDLRPDQATVVSRILGEFQGGARVVFLEAPTGSGKTIIGSAVAWFLGVRAVYSCHERALQRQYLKDFRAARMLEGRVHYETCHGPTWVTADDCTNRPTGDNCEWCTTGACCPYFAAKAEAEQAPMAVLNHSLLFSLLRYIPSREPKPNSYEGRCCYCEKKVPAGDGRLVSFERKWRIAHHDCIEEGADHGLLASRELCVLDEGELVEEALLDFCSVTISGKWMAELDLDPPKVKTAAAVSNDWLEWLVEAERAVDKWLAEFGDLDERQDVQHQRNVQAANRLKRNLKRLQTVPDLHRNFVLDIDYRGGVKFAPVWVDETAPEVLWDHFPRFLVMSATLISPEHLAKDLGVPQPYAVVRMRTDWDWRRRPIYLHPAGNMSGQKANPGEGIEERKGDEAWPAILSACREILTAHPNDRTIIHTVSYRLAQYLQEGLEAAFPRRPILRYGNADEKQTVLMEMQRRAGAVVVAPSLDRGVNLPGDLLRCQIIVKAPFRNVGDERTKARLYAHGQRGRMWYRLDTIRTLTQMIGRGMRGSDDWCRTYVIDSRACQVFKESSHLFPEWVRMSARRDHFDVVAMAVPAATAPIP